jgi:hypothetical protein
MVDESVVGGEDAVGQPVVAQELPDVLLRVQLGALGRQLDVPANITIVELGRGVPARLVQQKRRMVTGPDALGDLGKLVAHCLDVAPGQDQARRLSLLGADGAEDVGRGRALVVRCRWAGAAPGPAPGDLVLLPDPGLIPEPNLYSRALEALLARDRVQTGGQSFLKRSIAPSAWA